jgi:hypothetical protein
MLNPTTLIACLQASTSIASLKSMNPSFLVDFYSQVAVQTNDLGAITISYMIQNEFITLTLDQFGQILEIPFRGQAV